LERGERVKVKEVMQKEVTSLEPEDNALEALNLLFKMQISGLPVINAQQKLAGMFTEKDVLKYVLPSYIEQVGMFVYQENPKSTGRKFSLLGKLTVGELMRRDVVTTSEDITLCEAARLMLTQRIRRVPVVDQGGSVVGIVARGDILKGIAAEAGAKIN